MSNLLQDVIDCPVKAIFLYSVFKPILAALSLYFWKIKIPKVPSRTSLVILPVILERASAGSKMTIAKQTSTVTITV